jgi:hypothetical protein
LKQVEKSKVLTYSGKGVAPPAQGKHFLHLDDFTKDELLDMLDRAKFAKAKFYARDESFKPFKGMSMAMIFTKPSARTRVSFETVSQGTVAKWLIGTAAHHQCSLVCAQPCSYLNQAEQTALEAAEGQLLPLLLLLLDWNPGVHIHTAA